MRKPIRAWAVVCRDPKYYQLFDYNNFEEAKIKAAYLSRPGICCSRHRLVELREVRRRGNGKR